METVATFVARNVAELRRARQLSVRDLAARLEGRGLRMLASGISKIENGQREVKVDELGPLAAALGVSPLRLLFPGEPVDSVQLTSQQSYSWDAVWRWGVGEQPLPDEVLMSEPGRAEWNRRFIRENRPFEDPQFVREVVRALEAREPGPWTLRAHNDGLRTTWQFSYGDDAVEVKGTRADEAGREEAADG